MSPTSYQAAPPRKIILTVWLCVVKPGSLRLLTQIKFRITATDAMTFIAIPLLLTVMALAASHIPARRPARTPWSFCSTKGKRVPRQRTVNLTGRRWSFLMPVSLFLIGVGQGQGFAFGTGRSRDLQADGQSCLGKTAGN
jgi:hypothetical protein